MTHLLIIILSFLAQNKMVEYSNKATKNGMTVKWEHMDNRIYFEMEAPNNGWVTIGFNTSSATKGSYLLMGNITDNKPNVVEYYTLSAGNYQPISILGGHPKVENIEGKEVNNKTTLRFSLPTNPASIYAKNLNKGSEYIMLIAYSQSDDFQHHSSMRTSIKIKL